MSTQTEHSIIKVLLIEDNPDSIQLIQEEIAEVNHNKFELVCAERLSTGLELLNNSEIEVLLLDITLPDSQGIDTLIKAHAHAPEIPIVVLTNFDDETFAIKAVQEGAQDYLVKKHIDGNLISRSIRYAIERNKMLKELKQTKSRLQHMAHHDGLTSLPNRNLFYDHLDKSVARARRQETIMAVLFTDLDNFKQINDTLGHSIGDLLLLSVAKRLTECIRESDIVARIGGDEFTIILDSINSPHDAAKVAKKILEALSTIFILEGHKVSISSSIGISLYPYDSHDKESLIKNADSAMYTAKQLGKNNYKFFNSDLNDKVFKNKMEKEKIS